MCAAANRSNGPRLCDALRNSSWAWSRILDELKASTGDLAQVSGDRAAKALRSALSVPEDIRSKPLIDSLLSALGLALVRTQSLGAGDGRLGVGIDGKVQRFREPFFVEIGESSIVQEVSVIAHEIGHVVYACIFEMQYPDQDIATAFERSDRVENFCWNFSSTLLCPTTDRLIATLGAVDSLLTEPEMKEVSNYRSLGGPALDFLHIRAIARNRGISIRAVLRVLRRVELECASEPGGGLLSSRACGLAVLREEFNAFTGKDFGLRIKHAAAPWYGYVVTNQRAFRQGFSHAQELISTAAHMARLPPILEEFRLRERNPESQGPTWRKIAFAAACTYTAIDVKDEGRYLLSIWNWRTSLSQRDSS